MSELIDKNLELKVIAPSNWKYTKSFEKGCAIYNCTFTKIYNRETNNWVYTVLLPDVMTAYYLGLNHASLMLKEK